MNTLRWYPAYTEMGTPDNILHSVLIAASRLKKISPESDNFRTAGLCPVCKADGLISYTILPNLTMREGVPYEDCGHFCAYCKFSGSTYRIVCDE